MLVQVVTEHARRLVGGARRGGAIGDGHGSLQAVWVGRAGRGVLAGDERISERR